MKSLCGIFLRFASLGLVFAGAHCWADSYRADLLTPSNCGPAVVCTITDLNNEGQVLGQVHGGLASGLLLWGAGLAGGPFSVPWMWGGGIFFMAPWADTTTTGLDINDSGDVLFRGFGLASEAPAWGSITGYGVLRHDGTIAPDSTGTMLSDWAGGGIQLSNTRGQFVAAVPSTVYPFPGEIDYDLFTPAPVPEPSSLLLLGSLAVPALIRFRAKRRFAGR